MRIGLFQFAPRFGQPKANLRTVTAALSKASADLVVLPELAFTGYFFRDRKECLAAAEDPRSSALVAKLITLCRAKNFHIVTGFCEREHSAVYNSALVLNRDGIVATYRKVHLFAAETSTFDPGDRDFVMFEIGGVKIGVLVCFDWVFPEAARALALRGAQIIVQPANLVLDKCQRAMVTRSTENRVFTITANRHGSDSRPQGTLDFTGLSQIVSPLGEVIAQASSDQDELVEREIKPELANNKMITTQNHVLRDRRPSFYPR